MAKFKPVLLSIAIALVFVFFVGFGILTFYETPQYEDFCQERFLGKPFARPLVEDETCDFIEPDDNLETECKNKGEITPEYDENGCVESYYCETCNIEFRSVRENYNRNVFIIATIVGLAVLIIGFSIKIDSVSLGLMGGGLLTIIYGTMRYWTDLPDFGRFIILGITLVILIWLGYKKIKK